MEKNCYDGSAIWGLGGGRGEWSHMKILLVILSWVTKTNLKELTKLSWFSFKVLTYLEWTSIHCGYTMLHLCFLFHQRSLSALLHLEMENLQMKLDPEIILMNITDFTLCRTCLKNTLLLTMNTWKNLRYFKNFKSCTVLCCVASISIFDLYILLFE